MYREVEGLVELVGEAIEEKTPIHVVEQNTLRRVLTIGARTLQLLLNLLGTGDVGPTCELPDGRGLKRLKDLRTPPYQSVFAEFEVERYVYSTREGQKIEFVPLDTRLGLPESKFSFLLQDFDQNLAMEQPFGQVTSTIARILSVAQHVDSVERTNRKMGEQVKAFHASQQPPPAEEEAAIVVEAADGKGVPIRRPADAPRIQDHQRRSGPKPDRKKMATVASVYTVDPFIRTPEEVVESLFRDPRDKDRGRKIRAQTPSSLSPANACQPESYRAHRAQRAKPPSKEAQSQSCRIPTLRRSTGNQLDLWAAAQQLSLPAAAVHLCRVTGTPVPRRLTASQAQQSTRPATD